MRVPPPLLVTEGGDTEPRYFKAWATRLGISLEVRPARHPDPRRVVRDALQAREVSPARLVWAVLDAEDGRDRLRTRHYRRASENAQTQDLPVAVSAPCFEVWLLLHFEPLAPRPRFTNAELQRRLARHFGTPRKSAWPVETIVSQWAEAFRRAADLAADAAPTRTEVGNLLHTLVDSPTAPSG